MEHRRTIDFEESSGNFDSEDEEFSVGSEPDNIGVEFGGNIGGGGKKNRKKKEKGEEEEK